MVFWILTFLIALDVGLRLSGGFGAPILNDSPRVAAMQQFLAGSSRPNVVVLGSSLAFAANYYCDTKYATKTVPKSIADSMTYLSACYFEEALNESQAKRFAVANLSIPGGMAQDAYVIMQRLIQAKKRPTFVIYEIAPRDLVDNLMPVGCGALSGALESDGFSQSYKGLNFPPVLRESLDALGSSPLVSEWKRGFNRLGRQPTPEAVRDSYTSCIWQFYKCKTELKNCLIAFTCTSLGRQPTFYAAVASIKAKQTAHNPLCQHSFIDQEMVNYSVRYNPPNYEQFAEQSTELEKLAKLCKLEGINLLLVNMPMMPGNRALIDSKLYHAYRQELVSLTKLYECKLIDMDGSNIFHHDDFKDFVHLNTEGGKKFQDTLVQKMASILTL